MSRRTVVLSLMAVLMAAAGGGAYVALGHLVTEPGRAVPTPQSLPSILPTEIPGDATAQGYRALAATASAVTLASFVPPPGATRLASRPQGWAGTGPRPQSDPTLTRRAWWSTAGTVDEVTAYLDRGSVSNLVSQQTSSESSVTSGHVVTVSRTYREPADPVFMAYSAPWLTVSVESLGGGTYLGVSSYATARFPVPEEYRIGEPVYSIVVSTTTRRNGVAGKPATVSLTMPRDQRRIDALVTAYDALPGRFTVPMVVSCPAIGTMRTTTVTFSGASGHVWAARASTGCAPRVTVSLDGQPAGSDLDGSNWFAALQAALSAR